MDHSLSESVLHRPGKLGSKIEIWKPFDETISPLDLRKNYALEFYLSRQSCRVTKIYAKSVREDTSLIVMKGPGSQ